MAVPDHEEVSPQMLMMMIYRICSDYSMMTFYWEAQRSMFGTVMGCVVIALRDLNAF